MAAQGLERQWGRARGSPYQVRTSWQIGVGPGDFPQPTPQAVADNRRADLLADGECEYRGVGRGGW
jgi:hypothetical protein